MRIINNLKRIRHDILKKDYDFYGIEMPLRLMHRKYRNSYINNELEKLHPCYSNKFCCDIKYSLKKNKIFADVAVVNKERLAEYKAMYPHKTLFLEGRSGRAVFSSNRKKTVIVPFVAVLILAGCFSTVKAGVKSQNKITTPDNNMMAVAVLSVPQQACAVAFAAIKKAGGKIDTFSVENGRCSIAISGCHPEEVAGAEFCSVSYQNGVPKFTLLLKSSSSYITNRQLDEENKNEINFVPKLRHELLRAGCYVNQEQTLTNQTDISFSVPDDSFSTVLEECDFISNCAGWSVKSLIVNSADSSCSVKASFDLSKSKVNSICHLLSLYSSLFYKSNVNKINKIIKISREYDGEKVGEIIEENGIKISYYKNEAGKLMCYRNSIKKETADVHQ